MSLSVAFAPPPKRINLLFSGKHQRVEGKPKQMGQLLACQALTCHAGEVKLCHRCAELSKRKARAEISWVLVAQIQPENRRRPKPEVWPYLACSRSGALFCQAICGGTRFAPTPELAQVGLRWQRSLSQFRDMCQQGIYKAAAYISGWAYPFLHLSGF